MRLLRREILAGLAALAAGFAIVWLSFDYRIGSPARMGPGMFPLILGILLTLSGVGAVAQGLREGDDPPSLRLRPMVAVTAALVLFAVTIDRLGFVPAAVILIFVSGMSEQPVHWKALALLAAIMVPPSYLLFVVFLGIPVPAIVGLF